MFKSRLRHRRTIYLLVVTFILGNPCCSNPCQNQGVCMSVGFDHYKCDCTRTGFYGENCSTRKFALGCPRLEGGCIQFSLYRFESHDVPHSFHPPFFPLIAAEFLTRIKLFLKPTPNTVHYMLTHFKGVWNIVNNIPFLRNAIMKYVLTCKYILFLRL